MPNTQDIVTVTSGDAEQVASVEASGVRIVSQATSSFSDEIPKSVAALDSLAQRGDYQIFGMVFAGSDEVAWGRPDLGDLLARVREVAVSRGATGIGHLDGAIFPTGMDCCECVFSAGLMMRPAEGVSDNRRLSFVVALLPADDASSEGHALSSSDSEEIRWAVRYGLLKKGYYVVPILTDLSHEDVLELEEPERDSLVGTVAGLVALPVLESAESGFISQAARVRVSLVDLTTSNFVDESVSGADTVIDPLSASLGHYSEEAVCEASLDAVAGLRGIAR